MLGGPIVKNKAFFFADYEGLRQTRKVTGDLEHRRRRQQRQGILVGRRPRSAHRRGLSRRHADPDDRASRARCSPACPTPTVAGNTNNYSTLQEFTADSDKAGGKVDLQVTPTLSVFGRYGWRNLEHVRPAEHSAAVGRRRQRRHLRAQQAVRARHDLDADGAVAARGAVRLVVDAGRQEPARARHRRARSKQFGLPGLPERPAHLPAACRRSVISGYSDLGRQATNPQWQYPTVYNPKINYTWTRGAHSFKSGYEFQRIDTEVQDVNPLYGRDTYNGSFTRPAGAAASNLYNLADFMLGLRAQYALSSVLVADLRRNMHFAYLQDDWRATSKLTLNLGLRYEYSTPNWEENNVLSNYDPAANTIVLGEGRLDRTTAR